MKTIRTLAQSILLLLTVGAAVYSSSLRAEDIDIYFDNASDGTLPKVLFVLDNSSNLGSRWNGGGCGAYADASGAPSLGTTTAGGVIQCALVDALQSLPSGKMEVGIMAGNANGYATSRQCEGTNGGCLLVPFTVVTSGGGGVPDTRTPLVNFIKSWISANSENQAGKFPFTVNSAESGGMMQEAWAYFYGQTGLSGRRYTTNHIANCQKNFIIYLGNTDKTPSNEEPSGTALATAGAGSITFGNGTLLTKIKTTQTFLPAICGSIGSHPPEDNSQDWSENWADEWARYLHEKDGGTNTQQGKQNIRTYTIGIIDNASQQCTAEYPALLQSMAVVGGGEAYRVGDAGAVKRALGEALNEVQAENSVFSSASLPVSVNAEGSYLNQIFLGMFRPDPTGAPRWLGNLKQYQLIRNASGHLVMGDACEGADCPKPAINSATGFLSPNAISFWTYRDDEASPDREGGFFKNDLKGAREDSKAYDKHDGEVVEKGGVAQQLRKQNLTAAFTGASASDGNPRRVFTYCPDKSTALPPPLGDGCPPELNDPYNDFSTSNIKIVATDFGASLTVPVLSIDRRDIDNVLVTTRGTHGFRTGSVVGISNASAGYNVTKPVTVLNSTQFTMPIKESPPLTTTVGYTISKPGAGARYDLASISRSTSSNLVTVRTRTAHPFSPNDAVQVAGVSGVTEFNNVHTIESVSEDKLGFTFRINVFPTSPAQNRYVVKHYQRDINVKGVTGSGTTYTVETQTAHGFHRGQTVYMSGFKGRDNGVYNAAAGHVVNDVTELTFTITLASGTANTGIGLVKPSTSTYYPASVTHTFGSGTNSPSATVSVTGSWPARFFGTGDEIDLDYFSGASTGEPKVQQATGSYIGRVKITCPTTDCFTFNYTIVTSPGITGTGGYVTLPGDTPPYDAAAGAITRSGNVATVTGAPASRFGAAVGAQSSVIVNGTAGAPPADETAYTGTFQITCVNADCSTFTYPVAVFPISPAGGNNIQAYSGNTPPNKDVMIQWLRGHDNHGDELGPRGSVTVRPSMHGDVLHSRPLVINYGDRERGIVVFYGSNDGVYRAVNGNQTGSTTNQGVTVPAGGEFWGLILQEHYQIINRYRSNSPELQFPGTFLDTARPKDYFVDGPTGVYQKINSSGAIERAIIYLTMRRGGRFIYALDVTQPATPRFLWRKSPESLGFGELGYTWSRPRMTLLQNYTTTVNDTTTTPATVRTVHKPVIVFGAGYDPAHDSEPPKTTATQPPRTNTMGRGIFVLDAITGDIVFTASVSCDVSSTTCRHHPDMKHATPSDVAFVDRDLDGYTDKFYWGDLGGNIWRADVADAAVANWTVNRVAALGCDGTDSGECSSLRTPRKFFYPPSVLSVKPAGSVGSYDILSMVSGDREHPLRNDVANAAYRTTDRFFMIKDLGTMVNDTTLNRRNAKSSDLFDATYDVWNKDPLNGGSAVGFFINFIGTAWSDGQPNPNATPTLGEKAVNAPLAVGGQIFFATNQPKQSDNTCRANLGTARAYAINPFTGAQRQNELEGGGLPPSAVSGIINVEGENGETTQEKFCIGCGVPGGEDDTPCTSALENCDISATIPKNLKRTYWYKK